MKIDVLEGRSKSRAYQCTHTSTWTIIIYYPKLRMDLESVEEGIYILCFTVFELLENANFMKSLLDAIVFRDRVFLIILGVDVDDFQGHYAIVLEICAVDL